MSLPANSPTPDTKADQAPVVVKKYANRRLYNTESSSYITLDSLAGMIRLGRDFVVYDAKTGEDITRGVLTQIIVEEESKGRAVLPTAFLRQIIGFYGDSVQQLVPPYVEQALTSFAAQQEHMRAAMQQTMGSFFPFPGIEEVGRQNMAIMERAMTLFSPFYRPPNAEAAPNGAEEPAPSPSPSMEPPPPEPPPPEPPFAQADTVAALHNEIQALRLQLAAAQASAKVHHHASNGVGRPEEPAAPLPVHGESGEHG